MSEFDLATVDRLLTTTRAVRRRLDLARPVPRSVIEECLRLAIQAPSGGDAQNWHWIVVTDAETRAALAELYRRSRQRAEKDVEIPEHLLSRFQRAMRAQPRPPAFSTVPSSRRCGASNSRCAAGGWDR
jgi:nitroreductase